MSGSRLQKARTTGTRVNGANGAAMAASPAVPADFLVVGVGASAGGLDAYRSLLESIPPDNGMAFILVQHLDPSHESLMVELLKPHTAMQVCDAANGMTPEPDHVYILPPGMYLAVVDGAFFLANLVKIADGGWLPYRVPW